MSVCCFFYTHGIFSPIRTVAFSSQYLPFLMVVCYALAHTQRDSLCISSNVYTRARSLSSFPTLTQFASDFVQYFTAYDFSVVCFVHKFGKWLAVPPTHVICRMLSRYTCSWLISNNSINSISNVVIYRKRIALLLNFSSIFLPFSYMLKTILTIFCCYFHLRLRFRRRRCARTAVLLQHVQIDRVSLFLCG